MIRRQLTLKKIDDNQILIPKGGKIKNMYFCVEGELSYDDSDIGETKIIIKGNSFGEQFLVPDSNKDKPLTG